MTFSGGVEAAQTRATVDLDAVRALCDAATPGPWAAELPSDNGEDPYVLAAAPHNPGEIGPFGDSMESFYVAQTSYDGLSNTQGDDDE